MNKPKLIEVIHYYSQSGLKMKVIEDDKIVSLTTVSCNGNFECLDSFIGETYESVDFDMKPILFSMDCLTMPVLEGGLIPIEELNKKFSCNIDIWGNMWVGVEYGAVELESIMEWPFEIVKQLIDWHINVFGLDENEYIKKTLITKNY